MISIRKGTKSTVLLIVFVVAVFALTYFFNRAQGGFFYKIKAMLDSKSMLSGYHIWILNIGFAVLLLSSVFKVIFLRKTGFHVIGAFGIPLVFSACALICGLIIMSVGLNVRWFWLVYYIGLIICHRVEFGKMSDIKGAGTKNYKPFFKDLFESSNYSDSRLDIIVLQTSKIALIFTLTLLIVSLVVYCIHYRGLLPFFN